MGNNGQRSIQLGLICSLVATLCSLSLAYGQAFPRPRKDSGPKLKTVHGLVLDARGNPILGARVFIRDMKSKIVRTLQTDQTGAYRVSGLTPTVDYEVYAEFSGKDSEKKIISSYLDREDNLLNFQLDVTAAGSAPAAAADPGTIIKTFDLVELHASFEMPVGIPAPVPAVLLLHGYGEDRFVWTKFSKELLTRGFAVMTLDLRGHGQSRTKNGVTIQASPAWRTDVHQFPVDVDPALDWLKSRPRVDSRKIVVIGTDVGANLALIASGRFPEVRAAVAINPKRDESLALAGSAHDFQPRSTLVIVPDQAEGDRIKADVRLPSKVIVVSHSGGTAEWLADKQVTDAIFQWLKDTY